MGKTIEVILLEDVAELGRSGDACRVRAGYARNFLFPQKLAVVMTAGTKRLIEKKRADAVVRLAQEKATALEQLQKLRAAGVSRYHNNLETSRRFFPQICTTHTYDDKIRTIKIAQKEGLCVCSGGIIGMGENWDDRLDMAVSLAELGIESIPINALMPIKGTALEDQPQIPGEDVLRTIAFFRFINPEANIRLAAGRKVLPEQGATAFLAGASATITGDMLTTCGTTIKGDFAILKRLGLSNEGANDWDDDAAAK